MYYIFTVNILHRKTYLFKIVYHLLFRKMNTFLIFYFFEQIASFSIIHYYAQHLVFSLVVFHNLQYIGVFEVALNWDFLQHFILFSINKAHHVDLLHRKQLSIRFSCHQEDLSICTSSDKPSFVIILIFLHDPNRVYVYRPFNHKLKNKL